MLTIFVGDGWDTSALDDSFGNTDMFKDCTTLVGGKGTAYSAEHTDAEYARIDGGSEAPGYLTDKNDCSATVAVSDAGAATLVLPFGAVLPEGVKAYTLEYAGGVVTATEVPAITANEPVLINAAEGEYTFRSNGTTNAHAPQAGALMGVFSKTVVPAGGYVLTKKDGVVAFRKADGATNTVDARHAWLKADAEAPMLTIDFGGATGLVDMTVTPGRGMEGTVYNMAGQRVGQPGKGLYVVDGKKVMVK